MSARSSARTAWPSPPRHRHRRAESRQWSGSGRLLFGLLALLTGILALNGVIQAAGSSTRTSSGEEVDISSLLPPAAAAAEPAAADRLPAQVPTGSPPSPIARSSDVLPAAAPSANRTVTPTTVPRRATPAGAGAPVGTRPAAGSAATADAEGASDDGADDRPADDNGSAEQRSDEASGSSDQSDDARDGDETAGARDDADRPGRVALLPGVGCALDRVRIDGRSLVDTGCR